jgi:replicative DNA helicase
MNALVKPEDMHQLAGNSAEAERALLGACLSYPCVHAAMTVLEEQHFGEPVHGSIWKAMASLATDGKPVNPVTLGVLLGNEKISPEFTMRQYLAHLAANTYCTANYVIEAAKQVREFWALRLIIARCQSASEFASAPGIRPRDLIADLISELDGTRAALEGRKTSSRSVGEGVASLVDRIGRQRAGEIIDEAVPSCLRDLDRKLMGGFKAGDLIIVGGRPGMGKTILGVSCARQAARAGYAGGVFSLEMSEMQITARIAADMLYNSTNPLSAGQILQNQLSDYEAQRVFEAERDARNLPLIIDDSSNLTVGEIAARARAWKARCERSGKRLAFLTIDYLKFVRASERYRGQRVYEVGEITAGLKSLAKDMNLPVILLVQLSRKVEDRADKRPELADLRESGDIEADADTVLLLFREAYYLSKDPSPEAAANLMACQNKLEIIIAKQRMGETGTVDVFCHAGASAVRDLVRMN